MKKKALIYALCVMLMIGLAYWQIDHLASSQNLQSELQDEEMKGVLLTATIEMRKWEDANPDLRFDPEMKRTVTDSILHANFDRFDRPFEWGYFDGNQKQDSAIHPNTLSEKLRFSSLTVCSSCLVMIGIVPKFDTSEDARKQVDEGGYILDHTPAQMRAMRGLDNSKMEFLHVYSPAKDFSAWKYAVPLSFLLGLAGLFVWLISLNAKQSRLIKQKNEFVNHLSHQFQTPLSSIKLSANLLMQEYQGSENELLRIIQRESNRLENHIKTVLHWVKSDADRLHIAKERTSPTHVIEKSMTQMKPIFISHGTKVHFIPSEEEKFILVDVDHLQLMLFNIWENAIKHNDEPVEIVVSTAYENGKLSIVSEDNGKGSIATDETIQYKGLGLQYIQEIMHLHDGELEIHSEIDKGFRVSLNFWVDA